MRNERQQEFARLEGLFLKYGIPMGNPAWETLKQLEADVGNISAEQLTWLVTLIDQIILARNDINKQTIIAAVQAAEF